MAGISSAAHRPRKLGGVECLDPAPGQPRCGAVSGKLAHQSRSVCDMPDKLGGALDFYKLRYSADLRKLQDAVSAEVYVDFFGLSSWISPAAYARFYALLGRPSPSCVLDAASGWGAPALRLARRTGCSVAGMEFDPEAVASAQALTAQLGLSERV